MTKKHPMHRKKSIHMTFRRSRRVRNLFWRISEIFDTITSPKGKYRQ